MRSIGLEPRVNFEALMLGYQLANDFSKDSLAFKKLTFFTTGTVAETYPELLKEIANDGHEIACHYHYHNLMFKESNDQINSNLELAKTAIFKASGEEPKGFRAPVFSIPRDRVDIFEVIEKHFLYDSSYVLYLNKYSKEEYFKHSPFTLSQLKEFPIVPKPFLNKKISVKSGGTFLRLFTKEMMKEVMIFNHEQGFVPMVYIHPYDYLENKEFWVPLSDFIKSKKLSNLIKYPRQLQWTGLRNKTVFPKLEYLLEFFEHKGPMEELLE
tara:strand:- start:186 stop:992 length:807 start_codon:yes stop_codon:yes gene_type:complete